MTWTGKFKKELNKTFYLKTTIFFSYPNINDWRAMQNDEGNNCVDSHDDFMVGR